jgi:hypothetical protein
MSKREDQHEDLLPLLRSKNKNVNLPDDVGFYRNKGTWEIEMDSEQVTANLQTDIAAFEGWALAIKRWAGAKEPGLEVHLRWEPPSENHELYLHYERFLYRVIRFKEAVDWFKVAPGCSKHLDKSRVLKRNGEPKKSEAPFFVNVPGKRTEPIIVKARNAFEMSERDVELWLSQNPKQLLETVKWRGNLKRQVPVGVFEGDIKADTDNRKFRVFPGTSSKVDLSAVDPKKGVALFELKKSGNIKVGALSELIFYTHLVRDIGLNVFTYRYEDRKEFEKDLSSARNVRGFVLTDRMHPLFDKEAFGLLNKTFKGTGKQFGLVQYDSCLTCSLGT